MNTAVGISAEGLQIQEEIRGRFEDVKPKIGTLVLRRALSDFQLSHWLEPGKVVALEARLEPIDFEDLVKNDFAFARYVIDVVSGISKVPAEDILAGRGKNDVVMARHMAMYIIRQESNMSLPRIAKIFGRDHTSVMYAVQKVSDKILEEKRMSRAPYTALLSRLKYELIEVLQAKHYEKQSNQDCGILEAVAVTSDGMHLYPTDRILPRYARVLGIRDPETFVFDATNRSVSDELLHSYGGIAISLLEQVKS